MAMQHRARHIETACRSLGIALLVVATLSQRLTASDDPKATKEGNLAFGPTKVWTIHIEIPAKEYEAMQPALPAFGGPGAPPPPPATPKDKRDSERNLFGTEFPWAECEVTADGQTLKKVGICFAGDITYFVSASGLKRPLKIRFDKFVDQKLNGLTSLELHAMPLDPSKSREVLAISLFRAAGVAIPRAAFAEVTLTVPGKHDKALVGL